MIVFKDSKCSFSRDCSFGRNMEKLLSCRNPVPYHG